MVRSAPRLIIRAERTGFVDYDLMRLRELLVTRQRASTDAAGGGPPDPAGVILVGSMETPLSVGDPVMSVRIPEREDGLATELAACCKVDPARGATKAGESRLEIL